MTVWCKCVLEREGEGEGGFYCNWYAKELFWTLSLKVYIVAIKMHMHVYHQWALDHFMAVYLFASLFFFQKILFRWVQGYTGTAAADLQRSNSSLGWSLPLCWLEQRFNIRPVMHVFIYCWGGGGYSLYCTCFLVSAFISILHLGSLTFSLSFSHTQTHTPIHPHTQTHSHSCRVHLILNQF